MTSRTVIVSQYQLADQPNKMSMRLANQACNQIDLHWQNNPHEDGGQSKEEEESRCFLN